MYVSGANCKAPIRNLACEVLSFYHLYDNYIRLDEDRMLVLIQAISVALLQIHYYSEALPTQHGYCVGVSRQSVVCWALLRPILLSSMAPYKVHGALAPSVPPIKVFSVYHLHAPPPGRNVPLQWLVPQFGMASLCLSAHSLELFLSFLSQLKAVLFGRVGVGSASE